MSNDSKTKEVLFLAPTFSEASNQFMFYANVIYFSLAGSDSKKYRDLFVEAVNNASSVLAKAIDVAKACQDSCLNNTENDVEKSEK